MYVVNGQVTTRASFEDIAKQMEAGMGPLVMGRPGFQGYYIVQTGDRTGQGTLVFDTAAQWAAVKDDVINFFEKNIRPQLEGDGAVSEGECIVALEPQASLAGASTSAEARPH